MCFSMTYFIFLLFRLILLSTCPDFPPVLQNLQPWINRTSCHIHCSTWVVENWKKPLWIGTNINWQLSITPLSLSLVSLLVFELLPIILPFYPQLKLSSKPYSQLKSVPTSLVFQSISLFLTYKHGCILSYKETLYISLFHPLLANICCLFSTPLNSSYSLTLFFF